MDHKLKKIFWCVYIIVFLLKLLETFTFIDYYDPFAYHLAMPKAWYESSFLETLKSNDLYLLAGVFDYLYYIPIYLTGGDFYLAQKLSQFLHFFFSIGLGSVVLVYYFREKIWAPLAGLTLLTISKGATFFLVAKNDGPLSLAVFITFLLIYDSKFLLRLKGKRIFVIGFLFALIPSIKLNGLLYLLPLVIYFIWNKRKSPSDILKAGIFSVVLFFPTLYKNWIFIGNPFFPALLSHFPGDTTPYMRNFYTKFLDSNLEANLIGEHLKYFFLGKIIFLTSFYFIYKSFKEDKKNGWQSLVIASAGYLLYMSINGGLPAYRFIFPGYFLLTYFIFERLNKFPQKQWVLIVGLLLILVDSKIDKSVKALKNSYKNKGLQNREIVEKEFPYSKFWKHLKGKSRYNVISDYLTNSYYGPKGLVVSCGLVDRQSQVIFECANTSELKRYTYALLKEQNNNDCYKLIRSRGVALETINDVTLYNIENL